MAQCAQLQPQEDLPFFLLLTRDRTMAATTARRTRQITIVAMFWVNQLMMTDSFREVRIDYFVTVVPTLTFSVSFVASL